MIGLAVALVALAGAPHSPSACALAWNGGASAALHAQVARSRAHAAFIQTDTALFTDTWTKKTGTTSTKSVGCSITFVLPGGRSIRAWGAWRGRAVVRWEAIPATGLSLVPHNARVHADGTVGFTG